MAQLRIERRESQYAVNLTPSGFSLRSPPKRWASLAETTSPFLVLRTEVGGGPEYAAVILKQ